MEKIYWDALDQSGRDAALRRPDTVTDTHTASRVAAILAQVKNGGDKALRALTEQLGGAMPARWRLDRTDMAAAENRLPPELKKAIDHAVENIARFHSAQKQQDLSVETAPGILCELRSEPVEKVGLYVPDGTAPLVGTVLMLAKPASIAGCSVKVMVTPPPVSDAILYAAYCCDLNAIFTLGGAQAIAALAYGTETVPKVDKIFGPGNRFVTEAKVQVSRQGTAIDMLAGPSEVLVLADATANPEYVAADLLSQAAHGEDSRVMLVTDCETLARQVEQAIERQLSLLPRASIARAALSQSRIILAKDSRQACEISNSYAPEHLIVQTAIPRDLLPKLRSAGSIFLGPWTPESIGDYASGTSQILPTCGYARTMSSLSLADFRRRFTVQELTWEALQEVGGTVMTLAEAEGLQAHANAVNLRLQEPSPMSCVAQRLVRPEIARLTRYSSARSEAPSGEIWLNANESPWNNTQVEGINRYPGCQPEGVRDAYARYAGVEPEQVLITRGSDEGIDLLIRTFCRPCVDSVASCGPTYGMYAISAATNGVDCLMLDWAAGYRLPARFAQQVKDARLVFLCNPNNPSGTVIAPQELIALAHQLPNSLLVVDEAYIEFCPELTVAGALERCKNLAVLRTLSKAFAMAGARCGFVLASPAIIALLRKVIAPYPVPKPVALLAEEALSHKGIAKVQSQVRQLIARREALSQRLQTNPAIRRHVPSRTNYILFEMNDARRFYSMLAEKGFFIRAYQQPSLENWLRISIGADEDIQRIEQVLKEMAP